MADGTGCDELQDCDEQKDGHCDEGASGQKSVHWSITIVVVVVRMAIRVEGGRVLVTVV